MTLEQLNELPPQDPTLVRGYCPVHRAWMWAHGTCTQKINAGTTIEKPCNTKLLNRVWKEAETVDDAIEQYLEEHPEAQDSGKRAW